jgi:hypothetical protein
MVRYFIILAILGGLAAPLSAFQLEEKQLICPITGRAFKVQLIPTRAGKELLFGAPGPADMGSDEDGCRLDSGFNEYDYYVITSPWCYFSAMSVEWDENGRYAAQLPPAFKEWIQGKDVNGEWITDRNASYNRFKRRFGNSGIVIPDIKDWEIPQDEISVDKKYRLALDCYRQRGAPARLLAKLALNGAWAVRAHLNRPFIHKNLEGGVEEVNDRLNRLLVEGEKFNREKWATVYRDIFTGESLTDPGYFVAGFIHLGFTLRQGRMQDALGILDTMLTRFEDKEKYTVFRGLIYNRRTLITQGYIRFLRDAASEFAKALAAEEIPRPRMPTVVLAMAEIRRRLDDVRGAMDWYLCLAQMAETQPAVRNDLRQSGGAPGAEAPFLVHLGWQADQMIAQLAQLGVENTGKPVGEGRDLINLIIHEGLGTAEYLNPNWKPVVGKDSQTVAFLLGEVGKNLLTYQLRVKVFPDSLDDLWLDGYVKDRNALNRFCCPQTGDRFLYTPPADQPLQQTVLVATASPVTTAGGERYAAFTYGAQVVWSAKPILPGSLHQP